MSSEIEYPPQRVFYVTVCAKTDDINQASEEAEAFLGEMIYNTTPVGVESGRIQFVLNEDTADTSEEDQSTTWTGGAVVDIQVDPSQLAFVDDIHKWLEHINSWDSSLNLYLGEGRDQILRMSVRSI